ncbi:peptidoglycan-binding protein [Lederbergia panacisoli]|uniref:peptidoglycan-binding protein n=1 Tax=Lederbergia panacisoli TaxID=1255251 RepID=UPI00214ACF55|nr:peptidoglycan-binding protein [Lederbergia panacisoli]MCR2821417.1 peptidoglycan-binding protein [Lederbergia panacisoli]
MFRVKKRKILVLLAVFLLFQLNFSTYIANAADNTSVEVLDQEHEDTDDNIISNDDDIIRNDEEDESLTIEITDEEEDDNPDDSPANNITESNNEDIQNESSDSSPNVEQETQIDEEEKIEDSEQSPIEETTITTKTISPKAEVRSLATNVDIVLKNGIRDPRVIDLKKDLEQLGFKVPGNGTNLFGPDTEEKVIEFQQYYSVDDVKGVAGGPTLLKIEEILNSPLQSGKRDIQTITLKINLDKLGYTVPGNTTNYYGKETQAQVMAFQKSHGLVVNGIADPVTLKIIDELLNFEMSVGLYSDDVIKLKKDLDKLGFPVSKKPTTYYGPTTEAQVKAFQQYYNVNDPLGVAGAATLTKIKEILSTPLQYGKRDSQTINLKIKLNRLGHQVPGNTTNYYGKDTKAKVEEFQLKYRLVVNGIVDPVTSNKIESLLSAPLAKGLYRDDVITLKKDMSKIGFTVSKNPTNYYGSTTEAKVKELQKYYKLTVNGIADQATLKKINQVLSSPLQIGKKHKNTVTLKENLAQLGFKVPGNGTNLYGTETEKKVKEFQKRYGLIVNGIADEITLAKIDELLKNSSTTYNYTLQSALNIQMNTNPQTDKYRNSPAYIHSSLVDIITKAVISGDPVNLRKTPKLNGTVFEQVKRGTEVSFIEEVKGDVYAGSDKWYKVTYKKETVYVHSSLVSITRNTGKVNTDNSNIRESTNTTSHKYGSLAKDKTVTIVKEVNGTSVSGSKKWYQISFSEWRNAKSSDVLPYLNPDNNDKYQHLLLSSTAGLSAADLKVVLNDKGILKGTESSYIKASKEHNVNEIYLVAHSLLETGNGTSTLAKGVYVDKNGNTIRDSKGNLILDEKKVPKDAVKVYNMFGIAAVDSNATNGGAKYAFLKSWTTPEKAISGGAEWISTNYVNHPTYKQNTLYKMRWNPNNPGTHQYATDIGWAVKQLARIKNLYDQLPNAKLSYDITKYKK